MKILLDTHNLLQWMADLTVKKSPKGVLSRCEWCHDDYSLRVENPPQKPPEPGQMELN